MSVLKKLADGRIFTLERCGPRHPDAQPDDVFVIEEACDDYFYQFLTRDELRELARELNALADA